MMLEVQSGKLSGGSHGGVNPAVLPPAVCAACVPRPITILSDEAGESTISGSGAFTVRTALMDLEAFPGERAVYRWNGDVRVSTSLDGLDLTVPADESPPNLLAGLAALQPGRSADGKRVLIIFSGSRDFGTRGEAEVYAGSDRHRQLMDMIASFRG